MKKISFILLSCLFWMAGATGGQGSETVSTTTTPPPAFFEALYDVPVMPGLEELKDQAMLFDKPDGRIASVTAVSRTKGEAEISRFYADAMPALGWKKINENQYVRGDDLLGIELSLHSPYTVAKFTLSPRP